MRKFSLKKFNVEIPETLEDCSPNNYEDYISKKLSTLFQKILIRDIKHYKLEIAYQDNDKIYSITASEGIKSL